MSYGRLLQIPLLWHSSDSPKCPLFARSRFSYSGIRPIAQNVLWSPADNSPNLAFIRQNKLSYGCLLTIPLLRHLFDSPKCPMVASLRFPYSGIRRTAQNVLWSPPQDFPTLAFVQQPIMSYGHLLTIPLPNIRATAQNVLWSLAHDSSTRAFVRQPKMS